MGILLQEIRSGIEEFLQNSRQIQVETGELDAGIEQYCMNNDFQNSHGICYYR